MSQMQRLSSGGYGRLTYQPSEEEGPVPTTLLFLRSRLPMWRDDPNRPQEDGEKLLNSALCDFLDAHARSETGLPMIRFKHESPQSGQSTIDIGTHSIKHMSIGAHSYSIYQPFFVIECKRLPTPRGTGREKEYVTAQNAAGNPSGGIQRFKVGSHGARVLEAAIVGYVQKETLAHWHHNINQWIVELVGTKNLDGTRWGMDEVLQPLKIDKFTGTSTCISTHSRKDTCVTNTIVINHMWVNMHLHD